MFAFDEFKLTCRCRAEPERSRWNGAPLTDYRCFHPGLPHMTDCCEVLCAARHIFRDGATPVAEQNWAESMRLRSRVDSPRMCAD